MSRRLKTLIMVGTLLFVADCFAQLSHSITLGTIHIEGNTVNTDAQLIEVMHLPHGEHIQRVLLDSALMRLIHYYHDDGFLCASIDSIHTRTRNHQDSTSADLTVWITEGRRSSVGLVQINGIDDELYATLQNDMLVHSGRIFRRAELIHDIEVIQKYFSDRGYPLVHIAISDFKVKTDTVELILTVQRGPSVRIENIRIEGNQTTKTSVILRELRLRPGSIYRQKEIDALRERIMRTGFFKQVEEPEVLFVDSLAILTLRVIEGNASTMDGVLGYTPSRRDGEPGYFTGRLHFSFNNLLGTGRFFEAYWEKKDQFSQAMRFGIEEPWIMGWPLHIGVGFEQEIRDTSYVDREWRFAARYEPWSQLSFHVSTHFRDILPDSLESWRLNLPESQSWGIAAGIDYNTLDNSTNPTKGVRYQTLVQSGRKRNQGPDSLLIANAWKKSVYTRKIEIDAVAALSTFRRQVLYCGFHGREIRTGDRTIPISDQIRFGGSQTVRGYTEDAFRGSLVAWINAEYRFLFGPHSRIFLFSDFGIYQRKEENGNRIRRSMFGFGFGMRLETRLGLIGIDYGLGEGDSLMRGKVHVQVVNRF